MVEQLTLLLIRPDCKAVFLNEFLFSTRSPVVALSMLGQFLVSLFRFVTCCGSHHPLRSEPNCNLLWDSRPLLRNLTDLAAYSTPLFFPTIQRSAEVRILSFLDLFLRFSLVDNFSPGPISAANNCAKTRASFIYWIQLRTRVSFTSIHDISK